MIHTEEKLYLCSKCDKYFKQKQKLSEDKMKHVGEKPYH